jgi:hypothetical protein
VYFSGQGTSSSSSSSSSSAAAAAAGRRCHLNHIDRMRMKPCSALKLINKEWYR